MYGSSRLRQRVRDRIINPRGLCPKKGEVMAFNCKDLAVSGFEGDFDKENHPKMCTGKSCINCYGGSCVENGGGAVEHSSNLSILRQQLQQFLA